MLQKIDLKIYTRAGFNSQGYKDATGTTSQFDNPMGIAVAANNDIYVADNGNYCIRKITAFGNLGSAQTVTTFAGKLIGGYPSQGYADGAGNQAMFSSPTDLAFDASGNLYVADAGNNAIRKITPAGVVSTLTGGIGGYQDGTLAEAKFSYPTGIFVTSSGDIYVADKNNQKIRKISGNNVTTVVTGSPLWSVDDVVVASNGDLFISDQHRILKRSGSVTTVYAGNTAINQPGYANGVGNAATFNNVKLMMYSSTDNMIYVADMDNHVIRTILLAKPTDINNESNSILSVYPSPATDFIYLDAGNLDMEQASIIITDMNGRSNNIIDKSNILSGVITIPVQELQPGIYFLSVRTANDIYRCRFVKQ
jgi:energy-converting hydrogenase Eha subunit B